MNMFLGVVNVWWFILFFVLDMVSKFERGCYVFLVTVILSGIVLVVICLLQIKENLSKKQVFYIDVNDMFGEDDDDDNQDNENDGDDESMEVEFYNEEMVEILNFF